jgi:hypothetical protein
MPGQARVRLGMARCGEAGFGRARSDMVWDVARCNGLARRGGIGSGSVGHGSPGSGAARSGKEWRGTAWLGGLGFGVAR